MRRGEASGASNDAEVARPGEFFLDPPLDPRQLPKGGYREEGRSRTASRPGAGMDPALTRRLRAGALTCALALAGGLAPAPAHLARAAEWGLCAPSTLPPPPDDGLQASTLQADSVIVEGGGASVAEGGVVLSTPERTITSRRMDYDGAAARAEASGEVTVREREVYLEGDRLRVDLETGRVVMEDATFTHPDSHVRGEAERIEHEGGVTVATRGPFTTCDPGSSAWVVKASSVELDHEAGVGVARNARLRIFNAPVLYVPWISFPLGSERKSGFLLPVYETANNVGTSLTAPYYLDLAPNYDATLRPRFTSRRGPVLGGQFRYLTEGGTGAFEAEALPEDRVTGDSRSLLSYRHRHRLAPGLGARVQYARASDVDFLRDLGTGAAVTNTSHLTRSAELTYELAPVRIRAEVRELQVLRDTPRRDDPYRVVPRLALETRSLERNRRINLDFRGEAVRFDHASDLVANGVRIDLRPSAFLPFRTPRGYLLPRATLRFTHYALRDAAENAPASPDRAAPSFSVDGGLYLDPGTVTIGGRRFTQTLEPRLFYLRVPYREQDHLPIFDGGSLTSGYDHMFRENRFSGGDRIGDAHRLTLALDGRLLDGGGEEAFGARVGRMQHFRDRRVRLCTTTDPDRGAAGCEAPAGLDAGDRRPSAWIGAVRLRPHRAFTIGGAIEDGGGGSRYRAVSLDLRYHPSPERIVNLGYRRFPLRTTSAGLVQESVDAMTEAVGVSARRDLGRSVRVLGSASYALKEDTMTEIYGGLEYDSCCWRARVVAQRYLADGRTEHERAIMLQLELKGLTGLGAGGEGDDRSRIRPIPGYRNPF